MAVVVWGMCFQISSHSEIDISFPVVLLWKNIFKAEKME